MVSYPSDWEVKKLGECGKFVSGNGFPLLYQGKSKGTYPFYKVSDLSNEGNEHYMFKANNYISHEIAKKLSCNIVPSNSVIFAKIGAAIFLERKRITTCNCCIDNNMMSFQPFQNISSSFICYIMQKLKFGDYVQTTALPNLSGKILGNELIPLPPLPEQRAIADTLATFDTHIKNLSELIEKKKAIRDGALDDLMSGRTRLKGFRGEWKVKKLEDIASIQDGTHGTFIRVQIGKLLLSAKNVFNNSLVITENESMVSKSDYEKITSNGYPRKGDILMSCVGTIGRCCLLEKDDIAFQRSVAFIRPSTFCNKYLMFLLQSKCVQEQLTALINASAQGGIYLNSLKQIKLLTTTNREEQQAIANTITALDNEISNLEAERDKIIQIRDGTMNDLLTGKVRLIHGN